LETICLKCLHKEPQRRYGSAEALAEDLERWLSGEPIVARPLARLARLGRWCRRNPVVAGLISVVALLLFLGLGGLIAGILLVWGAYQGEAEQRRQADASAQVAREKKRLA